MSYTITPYTFFFKLLLLCLSIYGDFTYLLFIDFIDFIY